VLFSITIFFLPEKAVPDPAFQERDGSLPWQVGAFAQIGVAQVEPRAARFFLVQYTKREKLPNDHKACHKIK
jgi:hypothetical protein